MKKLNFLLFTLFLIGCGGDDPIPNPNLPPILTNFSFCEIGEPNDPCQFEDGNFNLNTYTYQYQGIGFPFYRNHLLGEGSVFDYNNRRDVLFTEFKYNDPNSTLSDQIFNIQIKADNDAYHPDSTLLSYIMRITNGEQNQLRVYVKIKYNNTQKEGRDYFIFNKETPSGEFIEIKDLTFVSDTLLNENEEIIFPYKHIQSIYEATINARLLLVDNTEDGNSLAVKFNHKFQLVFRDEIE